MEKPKKVDPHSPTAVENSPVTPKPKKKEKQSVIKLMAVQATKHAAGYVVSNYGNLTGDSLGQANLNGVLEFGGLGAMAITGGWLGLFTAGMSVGTKVANRAIDVEKSKVTSRLMMERVGNSLGRSQ